ncbi:MULTISPECIES: dTDP-4-dehydrorhamnose reductase [unclassified Lysobacter]|uniref:dTDP-4-dehydrorhamnose reductase n=1 Tax=unclassified Lysobacter TaxID=2635362 RepID=UPI0006FDF086|nr:MULTISPECIES: dTDP-4-dehydrorhamnose reductase [unclassified Lysobacter]KQZ60036.1 dTDP-4-dehydrorhamnose reductase [Lysobacter sp. Root559]KRC38480.1 dTDP-4-dehydrorhamnose reductase [Lysobacter sp. Root76]KRD71323.1 dTDP-4-dehydrorhamnose reductase [Lysobacter sp. Root96]
MKILLLGGNGQVGQELRRSLAPLGEVVVTTRSGELPDGGRCEALDLAELDAIAPLFQRVAPDIVVNATAHTAVDRAEDEPELAFRINAEAPGRIARACAMRGAPLLHYSTDYVFDGSGTRPYREDDATAPLGVYGASKLAGEREITVSGTRHLILRTAWVYATHGANFLRTMLRVGAERDELRVVADQIGSPTPAWLIADVSAQILRQGVAESGIRHLVAGGETTWHGFAEAIFESAFERGLIARRPSVHPIATADYPTRARRPAYSVLDTTRLRRDYGLDLPDWRAALDRTLATD